MPPHALARQAAARPTFRGATARCAQGTIRSRPRRFMHHFGMGRRHACLTLLATRLNVSAGDRVSSKVKTGTFP